MMRDFGAIPPQNIPTTVRATESVSKTPRCKATFQNQGRRKSPERSEIAPIREAEWGSILYGGKDIVEKD
jgi:hypothetical protein